jgi:hypothetical protein
MRSKIAIVAFLFAVGCCGGTLNAQQRTVPNPYGKTACEILTKAQVESVTGTFVTKMLPSDAGNSSIRCNYGSSTSLTIQIYLTIPTPPQVSDPRQVLAGYGTSLDCEQLSGVGDAAVSCISGRRDGFSRLWIYKGGRLLFEIVAIQANNLPLARNKMYQLSAMTMQGLGFHVPPGSTGFATADPIVLQPLTKPLLNLPTPEDSKADQLKHALFPMAERGNAHAQVALASLYRHDINSKTSSAQPNYSAAAYWYQEAAKVNLPEAQYELGTLYRDGLGVQKDEVTGNQFFLKAAQGGDASAMAALGLFYLKAAERNFQWDQAQLWLKKAVAAGDVYANTDLGVLYYETTRNMVRFRSTEDPEAIVKGYGAAMNTYRIAADAGDCVAKMNIGGLYFNGDGVAQDRAMAQAWFAKGRSCIGDASSELSKKATQFQQRAANGALPLVEPPPSRPTATTQGPKVSMEQVVFLGLAVLVANAVIEDSKRTPEERAEAAKNIERMHKENEDFRESHKSACLASYSTPSDPSPFACSVWN